MDQEQASAGRGRRRVGGWPGRQATVAEVADAWVREAAAYTDPIRHVLLTCAGEIRAALLAADDPAAYRALANGEVPPPAPGGPIFERPVLDAGGIVRGYEQVDLP